MKLGNIVCSAGMTGLSAAQGALAGSLFLFHTLGAHAARPDGSGCSQAAISSATGVEIACSPSTALARKAVPWSAVVRALSITEPLIGNGTIRINRPDSPGSRYASMILRLA